MFIPTIIISLILSQSYQEMEKNHLFLMGIWMYFRDMIMKILIIIHGQEKLKMEKYMVEVRLI